MQRFDLRQISENAQTDPDTRAIMTPATGISVAVAGSMRAADGSPAATRQLETRMTASKTIKCTLHVSGEGELGAGSKATDLTLIRERLAKQYEDLNGTNGRALVEGTKPVLVFATMHDGPGTLQGATLATYSLTIEVRQLEQCAVAIESNNFLRGCHDHPPWAAPRMMAAKDFAGVTKALGMALQAMKDAGGGFASHSKAEELPAQAQHELSELQLHGSPHAGKP
jgi:hypothetical protein